MTYLKRSRSLLPTYLDCMYVMWILLMQLTSNLWPCFFMSEFGYDLGTQIISPPPPPLVLEWILEINLHS